MKQNSKWIYEIKKIHVYIAGEFSVTLNKRHSGIFHSSQET